MANTILSSNAFLKSLAFGISIFTSLIINNANAVFINFDYLTYVPESPEWPHFADTPVTDQYVSQGLLVLDGYLNPYYYSPEGELEPDAISGPNYLLGSTAFALQFVGEKLPTYVGMYVGSGGEEAIFLEAYGASGLLGSARTEGRAPPTWDSPYEPRQYVSFEFAEGITQVNMWGAFGGRVSASVDDLTFTYADVPEPSSFILLCLGICAIIYKRTTLRK
jgi:hypothetical protein